jgi:hypothetical protein
VLFNWLLVTQELELYLAMMGFSLSQDLDLHLEPGLITEILDKLLLSSSSPLPPFMIPMYIEEMLVNTLRSLNMIEQPDLKQPDLLLSTLIT